MAAARARFAGDGPLVTFAGRLVYEKGVQHLIAALPRLRERHPGLRAVIAGDGPYRAELEAEVHRHGLGGMVTMPGFLGGTDLPALMAASDCFAVPSIYEPFGMVALEGAAAGAPLAVAATGGLGEIVEPGVDRDDLPPARPGRASTDAVDALLSDPDRARVMARRARRMVHDQYGWAADRPAHRRQLRRRHPPRRRVHRRARRTADVAGSRAPGTPRGQPARRRRPALRCTPRADAAFKPEQPSPASGPRADEPDACESS